MSTRISEGGRLFGIMAGLGGAAMIGGASLSWREAIYATPDNLRYEITELRAPERRAILVLGLFVIAGAACFIALRSRRIRMTAGALVVLVAAAGLIIALRDDPRSTAELFDLPCTDPGRLCLTGVGRGVGDVVAGLGAALAAGFGIVALLRSGGGTTAAERSSTIRSEATPPRDFATPNGRRMSDASLLGLTLTVLVIALVVAFFVIANYIYSHDSL